MLCSKCNQNEATVHLTTVAEGTAEESVHLCKDCAASIGFNLDKPDLKDIEALLVVGKKCEFCGRDAFSGQMRASGGAIFWCFECGLEFGGILMDLLVAERPDLLQQSREEISLLSFYSDTGLQSWSAAASQKAVQTLKERRRQDGRDKGS
jgi:hypothetical protein